MTIDEYLDEFVFLFLFLFILGFEKLGECLCRCFFVFGFNEFGLGLVGLDGFVGDFAVCYCSYRKG